MDHATELTAEGLWNAISRNLRETLSETTYETWFGNAEPRSLDDGRLVVVVPNDFTRDWIEGHFRGFIAGAAREASGREDLAVSIAIGESTRESTRQPAPGLLRSPWKD